MLTRFEDVKVGQKFRFTSQNRGKPGTALCMKIGVHWDVGTLPPNYVFIECDEFPESVGQTEHALPMANVIIEA